MPRGDPNAIRLTKKFVVCKRHNLNAEDFPKFEEKATVSTVQQQRSTVSPPAIFFNDSGGAAPTKVSTDNGKPPPKKRGRKPRSYFLALEEAQR
jgi:hypothetical protein